ncbi:MAG TPA: hypothetical protein VJN43_19885 [Bryobacteraceae bacterium]|nr:hypothetical protein [Bryobacteraceae bacterium]
MDDRVSLQRKLRVLVAAALAGALTLALVDYALLPFAARKLNAAQRLWLREACAKHPGWLVLAIVLATAMLALPVLLAGLWAARRDRRRL